MLKVLILNHKISNCGVYQIGKRIFDIMKTSNKISYTYKELDSYIEYTSIVEEVKPQYIIYNYHNYTMSWLSSDILKKMPQKHIIVYHERQVSIINNYHKYIFLGSAGDVNPIILKNKSIVLPRPLLLYTKDYPHHDNFTIGSFGFGFFNKGFHTLTERINKEIPNAILRLHLPYSYFGDHSDNTCKEVIDRCKKIATSITLVITRDFLPDDKLLNFLAANDINIFNYEIQDTDGVSSVIDYALSVKRPIAVSNCSMFRHILSDDILLEKNTIKDIYEKGIKPLERYYQDWAIPNFVNAMDNIFLEDI